MAKKWMQQAFANAKGQLHRMLGIPKDKPIPITLLKAIMKAKTGSTIKNPTKSGKQKIKVTALLKKRANPVLTAKKINRKRK